MIIKNNDRLWNNDDGSHRKIKKPLENYLCDVLQNNTALKKYDKIVYISLKIFYDSQLFDI